MKYQSFSSTKRKIPKIQEAQKRSDADFANEVNFKIKLRPETFVKNGSKIILLKDYLVPSLTNAEYTDGDISDTGTSISFIFTNLDTKLLSNLKLIPIFNSFSAYKNLTLNSFVDFNYVWEFIDNTIYKLHIHISKRDAFPGASLIDGTVLPIFLNLYLYFLNNFNYVNLNANL